MNEIPQVLIPYEELKHVVITCIASQGTSFQFKSLCNAVGAHVVKNNHAINPNPPGYQALYFNLHKNDENKVREIIWDLITERVLTIGDFHNDSWPWLSLTEYGQKAVKSKHPVPNDPSGYMDRIKKEVETLDEIIEGYLLESIKTYNINQLLSSTITLGCASERALLLLIEVFSESFKDVSKQNIFLKKVEGKFIKTQFDEFDKAIRLILPTLPYTLKENYANTLTGVFQMIRYNRNSAGHPTGLSVDKETQFANLQVFIPYCKFIYDLMDHLKKSSHE